MLEIDRIYDLDDRLEERYNLSESQYEAHEQGYFASPRGVSASELATDLGISQQALSERLRRASRSLLDETLATDDPPGTSAIPIAGELTVREFRRRCLSTRSATNADCPPGPTLDVRCPGFDAHESIAASSRFEPVVYTGETDRRASAV